jgi:hypothetical protein
VARASYTGVRWGNVSRKNLIVKSAMLSFSVLVAGAPSRSWFFLLRSRSKPPQAKPHPGTLPMKLRRITATVWEARQGTQSGGSGSLFSHDCHSPSFAVVWTSWCPGLAGVPHGLGGFGLRSRCQTRAVLSLLQISEDLPSGIGLRTCWWGRMINCARFYVLFQHTIQDV